MAMRRAAKALQGHVTNRLGACSKGSSLGGALKEQSALDAAIPGTSGRTWQASRGYASAPNPSSRGPVSYLSLALTMATGGGIIYYYDYNKKQRVQKLMSETKTAGVAAIGGPFQLVDGDGKPFSDKDLLGNFAILYFGFTFCPDICPDELDKLGEALNLLEKSSGAQVQPVFISIDPERDNVAQVKTYVSEFHPRMIGLTGTLEQTKEAARAYRVYYTKTDDSSEDYLVDHSIIMYLIDPEGKFVTFYGKNFTAEQLAESMEQHVKTWQIRHPDFKAVAAVRKT